MMFTVKGYISGLPATLTYSKGLIGKVKIRGDPESVVDMVLIAAKAMEGIPLGPVGGPYFTKDYLKDPLAAVFLLRELFDEGAEFTGDIPEPPKVPEGAII